MASEGRRNASFVALLRPPDLRTSLLALGVAGGRGKKPLPVLLWSCELLFTELLFDIRVCKILPSLVQQLLSEILLGTRHSASSNILLKSEALRLDNVPIITESVSSSRLW